MNSLHRSCIRSKGGLLALLVLLVLAAAVLSMGVGAVMLSPGEVLSALLGRNQGSAAYSIVC